MADVLNPTDNNMPDPPRVPRIGNATPAGVPIPASSGVSPQQMLERAASENEVVNAENRALSEFDPAAPIPYKPANWSITGNELYPSFEVGEGDLEAAEGLRLQFQQAAAVQQANSSILNTIGGTLSELRQNQTNFGNWVPSTAPADFELPEYTKNAWASRAQQQQNMIVAPGISNGLAGITRAYGQGMPLRSSARDAAMADFFRRRFGVDFTGIDSPREEVAPPSLLDRSVSAVSRAGRAILGGPLNSLVEMIPGGEEILNNLTPMANPNEPAAVRRILGAAARIAGERSRERIDAVGLPQFLSENTWGRLNPARSDSLGRVLLRQTNPIRIFEEISGVETGIGPGYFTPAPTPIQPQIGLARTAEGLPAVIPGRPDLGDPGFFGELAQSSPELRNLIRSMEPVINEAGIVGFNPTQGYFGDYGSAGSLSGLLWLAAMPESIITGAIYDTVDMIRALPYNERVDRLLGAHRYTGPGGFLAGSLLGSQYAIGVNEQSLRRIDTLTGLLGRDTSFFQEWQSDRYLAVLGNPELTWLSPTAQIALGFLLDTAVGGFSDAFIVEPLFNAATRGRRAAAAAAGVAGAPPPPPIRGGVGPINPPPPPSGPRPRPGPTAPPGTEMQPSTDFPVVVPELTVLPSLPAFSSKIQADSVARRLTQNLLEDEQALRNARAVGTNSAQISRLESRVAANRARLRAIEEIDWNARATTATSQVFNDTAASTNTPTPRNPETLSEVLTSPSSQVGDVSGANELARNLDISARGGTDVTPDVTNFRRDGTVISDIPVARVAPEVVIPLPSFRPLPSPPPPVDSVARAALDRVRGQIGEVRSQLERARPFKSYEVDDAGDLVRRVSYPANSSEEIFTNFQTSLDNLLREEQELSKMLEGTDFTDYVDDAIRLSGSGVTDAGVIVENSNSNQVLDALLPAVNIEDVSPTAAASLPEAMAMAPVTGVDISGRESLVVRRNDDILDQLAQLWGVRSSTFVPSTPQAQLSNMLRQEVLEREFPNLLGRYGPELPQELLSSNANRVVVQQSGIDRPRGSLPSSVNRRAASDLQPSQVSDLREARKRVNRLSKAAQRSIDNLIGLRNMDNPDFDAIQRELSRLSSIRSNIDLTYADYPELAVSSIIETLPDNLRPVGQTASTFGAQYAYELRRFHRENQLLNKLGHELAITDVFLQQQKTKVLSLPPVQRISAVNEFATIRQYDPEFNMHGVDEHDIPDDSIIADLSPAMVQNMSVRELTDYIMRVSNADEQQATQAIFNGLQTGQLRRQAGRYFHTGETLEDLFKRADELGAKYRDGTVSLAAYKAAKEATQDLTSSIREIVDDVVDLNFRRRLREGKTQGVAPDEETLERIVESSVFDDPAFNRMRQVASDYQEIEGDPEFSEMLSEIRSEREAAEQLSDELSVDEYLENLGQTTSELREATDSIRQVVQDAEEWIENYEAGNKTVSGITPEGQRVFGYELPSGEVVTGTGNDIEPVEVSSVVPINSVVAPSGEVYLTPEIVNNQPVVRIVEGDITPAPVRLPASGDSMAPRYEKTKVNLNNGTDQIIQIALPRTNAMLPQEYVRLQPGDTLMGYAGSRVEIRRANGETYDTLAAQGVSMNPEDVAPEQATDFTARERYYYDDLSETAERRVFTVADARDGLRQGDTVAYTSPRSDVVGIQEGTITRIKSAGQAGSRQTIMYAVTDNATNDVVSIPHTRIKGIKRDADVVDVSSTEVSPQQTLAATPTEETILSSLAQAGEQFDNYTPLYVFRNLPEVRDLSRAEQDALLYRWQSEDIVELSTIQDVSLYTEEQRSAALPGRFNMTGLEDEDAIQQNFDLFYVTVNELPEATSAAPELDVQALVANMPPMDEATANMILSRPDDGTPLSAAIRARAQEVLDNPVDVEEIDGDLAQLTRNMDELDIPEIERVAWRQAWEREDYKDDVVWYDDATSDQQDYMERTGSPYLSPTIADEQEIMGQFPDPEAAYEMALEAGYEGEDMFEVLARYSQNPNDPETANLWPIARERVEGGEESLESMFSRADEISARYADDIPGEAAWMTQMREEITGEVDRMLAREAERESLTESVRAAKETGNFNNSSLDRVEALLTGNNPDSVRVYISFMQERMEGNKPVSPLVHKVVRDYFGILLNNVDAAEAKTILERFPSLINGDYNPRDLDNFLPDKFELMRRALDRAVEVAESTQDRKALLALQVARRRHPDLFDGSAPRLRTSDPMDELVDQTKFLFDEAESTSPNIIGDSLPARTMFHGTHAQSLTPGIKASAPTNELGMGMYVTTNVNEATLHARAQVAQDVVIQGRLRPKFTEDGRVFELLAPPVDSSSLEVREFQAGYRQFDPPNAQTWNVVDGQTVMGDKISADTPGSVLSEVVRDVLKNTNRANPIPSEVSSAVWRRFSQWSKRHPYREWHQYLRAQLEKEMGEGAQRIVVSFQQDIQNELVRRNVDAIKDGNTYNIVNPLGYFIDKVHPDVNGRTDVAGQLAARVEIEKIAYARNPSVTNMAKLEQAYLDYNTYRRNNLADAVGQQEITAAQATRELGVTERNLEEMVDQDRARMLQQQIDEAEQRAMRMADDIENIDGDCP